MTSPVSPISPVNPASPTSSISATTTPSAPVTATTQTNVQSSPTTDGSPVPSVSSPAPSSTAQTDVKSNQQPSQPSQPKIGIKTLPLALSLELVVKPGLTQPSMFSEPSLVQGLPLEVLLQDKTMMELLFQPSFDQQMYQDNLGFEQ